MNRVDRESSSARMGVARGGGLLCPTPLIIVNENENKTFFDEEKRGGVEEKKYFAVQWIHNAKESEEKICLILQSHAVTFYFDAACLVCFSSKGAPVFGVSLCDWVYPSKAVVVL